MPQASAPQSKNNVIQFPKPRVTDQKFGPEATYNQRLATSIRPENIVRGNSEASAAGGVAQAQQLAADVQSFEAQMALRYDLELQRNQAAGQTQRILATLQDERSQIKAPSKAKYVAVGYFFALPLDILNIIGDFGGDEASVGVLLIIREALKFVFGGVYYVLLKGDQRNAEDMQALEADVQSRIKLLDQRTQNLRQQAREAQRLKANPHARDIQKLNASDINSQRAVTQKIQTGIKRAQNIAVVIQHPILFLKQWMINLLPGGDLFRSNIWLVYKAYKTSMENYHNMLNLVDGDLALAYADYEQTVRAIEAEEAYQEAA